jgi:histo-blood group ABO system transferase
VAAKDILSQYQQVFYCDADMKFVAPVSGDEIFSNGITATLHPGYIGRRGDPELHPESTAYCPDIQRYFCGGFNGGTTVSFLTMAEKIADNIAIDDGKGVQAKWVDESHMNRYLHENPPAKILSPSFCYPEGYAGGWGWEPKEYTPKLIALWKGERGPC